MMKSKRGGKRINAGRKPGSVKGRKTNKQIQVSEYIFLQLKAQKIRINKKSWDVFFTDILELLRQNSDNF